MCRVVRGWVLRVGGGVVMHAPQIVWSVGVVGGGEEFVEMGGCGRGRGRGMCIVGIGGCRVGGCSIYSIYRCDVCGW